MQKIFSILSRIAVTALPLMLLSLLCGSCSKEGEDTGTPIAPIAVSVGFTLPAAVPMEEMGSIDLFAFDGAGMFAGRWNCPGSEISVDLTAGEYTFVAWGNLPENHTLKPETLLCGQTHIDDMSLRIPNAGAKVFAGRLSPVQVLNRISGQTFQVPLERTAVNMTVDIGINDWSVIRNNGIDL